MQVDFPLDIDIFDDTDALAKGFAQRMRGFSNAYMVVTGKSRSAEYAERLLTNLLFAAPVYQVTLSDNSVSNIYATERDLRREIVPRLIVAIGGGKVADFSKRLAYIANIPLLLIPTIIANDGLISPIAVLHDEDATVSLPGRMPDTVLIDMQIIGSAPLRYLRSAACDLITNLSATNDWERSTDGETGRMHHLALQLSRMAAHKVLDCREWRSDSPTFLRSIVYGQMLSGIAMALAGSSRPCSGSEHLISHALDALSLGTEILHGEKVGITSRFCLQLQQQEDPLLENFFSEFGVARSFPGCKDFTEKQMVEIFTKARGMRPGRSTILDAFTDEELARRYAIYIARGEDRKI